MTRDKEQYFIGAAAGAFCMAVSTGQWRPFGLILMALAACIVVVSAIDWLRDRRKPNILSDDELNVLGHLYEAKHLHPDDIKPEVSASLFRHGLIRSEADEITLSDLGIRLMDGAKFLAEKEA